MALEVKNINNASDMRNYVEGCLNDLMDGLSTKEETMGYFKEYTHRIIDLASASQNASTSEGALPISDVVGLLPSDEDLDEASISFVNEHCDNVNGDLTTEAECFDAGAIWMRKRLIGQ